MLRRGIEVKKDKKIGDLLSPLIFGVLAHSHKSLGNRPDRTVDRLLQQSSADVSVPRESLDLVCIADSNCWHRWVTIDIPWPPGHPFHNVTDKVKRPMYGQAFASMGERLGHAPQENYPVAALIGGLWDVLAQRDESLRGIRRFECRRGLRKHDGGDRDVPALGLAALRLHVVQQRVL